MKAVNNPGISFFEKNLTVWVVLCMVTGVLIGRFLPGIPVFLSRFEYAKVSIPIAVLIWLMIYPMMMMKVDFTSIKNVGRNPRGLYVTWVVNWLIKPFTMFGVAAFFFYVVFKSLIPPSWPGTTSLGRSSSVRRLARRWCLSGATSRAAIPPTRWCKSRPTT
jgi:ACR3 family arsenite transporter